jgi:hypothetical protein
MIGSFSFFNPLRRPGAYGGDSNPSGPSGSFLCGTANVLTLFIGGWGKGFNLSK